MTEKDLEKQLEKLKENQNNFFLASRMIADMLNDNSETTYHLKRFVLALFNRNMAIIEGHNDLITTQNFTCIAPLVRVYLDSLIRFSALLISSDPNKTAKLVSEGKHIRNLEDLNGKKMSDRHLVNELNKKYDWIKNLYTRTSGYIHFSGQHISDMTTSIKEEDNLLKVTHLISKNDLNVKIESWYEIVFAMNMISKTLYELTFKLFENELKEKYPSKN